MLIRIVRMTFKKEAVSTFLHQFEEVKERIRHFEGCHHLELWEDYNDPAILSSYSIWDDEAALDRYRHSDFFKATWAKTKVLFADKPKAFSFKKKFIVD